MDRIFRLIFVSWIVLSSIHMLVTAQDTIYSPPPPPDSNPITPPPPPSRGNILKKLFCDAKCSLQCFRRASRWRTPFCMGICLAKCLITQVDITYDCTTKCAFPTIASFQTDVQNLDGLAYVKRVQDSMNKCYGSCEHMVDQEN